MEKQETETDTETDGGNGNTQAIITLCSVVLLCLSIAYYISMVCVWCTKSYAAGSLWWL